jgi:hypothetical protein
MRKYKVTLVVNEQKLPSVLHNTLGAEVQLENVVPITGGATSETTGGKLTGQELIIQTLESDPRPFRLSEIKNIFIADGRSAFSAYQNMRQLVASGKILDLGDSKYAAPGAVVRMGATAEETA